MATVKATDPALTTLLVILLLLIAALVLLPLAFNQNILPATDGEVLVLPEMMLPLIDKLVEMVLLRIAVNDPVLVILLLSKKLSFIETVAHVTLFDKPSQAPEPDKVAF